ncbi:MAG TPA: hypothetical protein VLJ88_13120, partial [Propionibacteriaceae bacterium]|nr:hypothetical protein [Propionibacteriaceae bacterium]
MDRDPWGEDNQGSRRSTISGSPVISRLLRGEHLPLRGHRRPLPGPDLILTVQKRTTVQPLSPRSTT